MTLRALVLDFGGVISRTLFETHALSEQALGLAPDQVNVKAKTAEHADLARAVRRGR